MNNEEDKAFLDRGISLISNGIDAELFKLKDQDETLAETSGLHRGETVMGFVGELREKKDFTTLLSAYTKINETQPTTLLIVGDVRIGEDKK